MRGSGYVLEVRFVESSKRLINFRCAETNISIGQTFEAVQESCCEFSVKSPSLVRRNIPGQSRSRTRFELIAAEWSSRNSFFVTYFREI